MSCSARRRARSTSSSARTGCSRATSGFKQPRSARGRRGAALRRAPQGTPQGDAQAGRRAHALSATPIPRTLVPRPDGRARPVDHRDPAAGPSADPHRGQRFQRGADRRGPAPRDAPRWAGLLRAQPGRDDRRDGRDGRARWCPEARVLVAHGQMHEHELESIMKEFIAGEADVLVTTMIIESGLDMPNVNTILIDRADRLGPQPAPPAARAGGAQPPPGLRLPHGAARPDAHPRGAGAPRRDPGIHGSGQRLPRRDAGSRDPRARATSSANRSPGTSPPSASISTARCSRRRSVTLKGEGLPRLQDVRVDLRAVGLPARRVHGRPRGQDPLVPRTGTSGERERSWTMLADELRDRFGALPPAGPATGGYHPTQAALPDCRGGRGEGDPARAFALFSLATGPRTPVSSRTCLREPDCRT